MFNEDEYLNLLFDKFEFKVEFLKYWRNYCNLIEDHNIHSKNTDNTNTSLRIYRY